jgi:hypothetical protein
MTKAYFIDKLKIHKILFGVITIFIILLTLFCALIITIFPRKISLNKVENIFDKKKDTFIELALYFEDLEYSDIYISSASKEGNMSVVIDNEGSLKHIQISDTTISKNLYDIMKKYRYSILSKSNNCIYFQLWANIDYGRGIVYSMDGYEPKNEYITILEPLSENDWYFYEER